MANIVSEKNIGNILILQVDANPSLDAGIDAPMGSLATILGVGDLWQKTGTEAVDWSIILAGTGAPVSIGTTNAEGEADLAARADHVHAHGNLAGGSLHDLVTTTVAGFMSANDKIKLNGIGESASLAIRSGVIPAVSFIGNPRKATVNFTNPMPSTNYSITMSGQDSRVWTFENKTLEGFILNSNAASPLAGETQYQVIETYS